MSEHAGTAPEPPAALRRVLVSHSRQDSATARAIGTALADGGMHVLLDEGAFGSGESAAALVQPHLAGVDVLVSIVEPGTMGSHWAEPAGHTRPDGVSARGLTVVPLRRVAGGSGTGLGKLFLPVAPAAGPAVADDVRAHLSALRAVSVPPTRAGPVVVRPPVPDEVRPPRDDGSPGSGLYVVPLPLSETPDRAWAELFTEHWRRPPRWPPLTHRPDIAEVVDNRLLLRGTTVHEVNGRHWETLRLVLAVTNEQRTRDGAAGGTDVRSWRQAVDRMLSDFQSDD
ncbi:TIR domain-containing protein [Actinokineospora auranticolor]|uniref:TIR domain-containing protein n=1 Tax=Actinokineospora auranticolor TaxID=155976 RepID=A0A2S6GDB5_9PSEU|nr:TIR domain-containing protein [Actinokineospora auranticolor]PPK63223.1 TIR domain-containing protein [Actinokineospora auranticolor]